MCLDPTLLPGMTALELRQRLAAGERSVSELAQARTHLDRAHVLRQAESADEAHAPGEPEGPLFGLPVGIKDIIDTVDLPTEDGTVLHAGCMPTADAALVMGKTVTTELATQAPGKTRNPHHPAHTPGGSSSGSAAAVAAGMVPLAIGTQTNGSVIRPASFCGVYGFKPSAGLIPRSGVLTQSPPLDAVGVFGRSLQDVALLAQVLAGHDPQDPMTQPRATPPLLRMAGTDAVLMPTLAWVATPFWDRVAPDAQAAFGELLALLEGRVAPFELPATAADAVAWHKTVMEADLAGSFTLEYERGAKQLSDSLRVQIERGRGITAVAYREALARIPVLLEGLDSVFDHYDALLTPSTLGTAPEGLASTGDPLMCTLWTFLGLPCLNLPLLQGENGLPIGVQLVGRRGDDARLLRTARWLVQTAQTGAA